MSGLTKPPDFKNSYYQKIEQSYLESFTSQGKFALPQGQVKVSDLRHVYFELSNMCGYSNIHPQCPVSWQKKKTVLRSEVVKKVLDELGRGNFRGHVAFHRYNEPLSDPRLFSFIAYARLHCPEATVRILTNGFYLNQTIADEFHQLGVGMLEVSAYSLKEYDRLVGIKVEFPYKVFFSILDDRKSQYERAKLNLPKPCLAMIDDVTINCEGKMPLCCLDWKNQHLFGDLNRDSLAKILSSKFYRQTYRNLIAGRRSLDLCSRCDWQR